MSTTYCKLPDGQLELGFIKIQRVAVKLIHPSFGQRAQVVVTLVSWLLQLQSEKSTSLSSTRRLEKPALRYRIPFETAVELTSAATAFSLAALDYATACSN